MLLQMLAGFVNDSEHVSFLRLVKYEGLSPVVDVFF